MAKKKYKIKDENETNCGARVLINKATLTASLLFEPKDFLLHEFPKGIY